MVAIGYILQILVVVILVVIVGSAVIEIWNYYFVCTIVHKLLSLVTQADDIKLVKACIK